MSKITELRVIKSTQMTYYFGEILKCAYDGHTLLSHEATREDLGMAATDAGR